MLNQNVFIMLLPIFMVTVNGCNGQLYTVENAKPLDCCKKQGDYYSGVRVYSPAHFIEVAWLTAVLNDKGEILQTTKGIGSKKCHPQAKVDITTRPDYSHPLHVVYKPGFLETNKFGLELKDGILMKVNTESTPDKGETFKNLSSAAVEAGKLAGIALTQPALCTHRPELKHIVRLAEACPNGSCDLSKYFPSDTP